MRKRVLGYFLSAASVYVAARYIAELFLNLLSNFALSII